MQKYIDALDELYICAVKNGASTSVAYNPNVPQANKMKKYFEEVNIWWHPGLNIATTLIPFAGLQVWFSYLLLGVTVLKYWGEDMAATIDLMVPPYKDVITPVYTKQKGTCKRSDGKAATTGKTFK